MAPVPAAARRDRPGPRAYPPCPRPAGTARARYRRHHRRVGANAGDRRAAFTLRRGRGPGPSAGRPAGLRSAHDADRHGRESPGDRRERRRPRCPRRRAFRAAPGCGARRPAHCARTGHRGPRWQRSPPRDRDQRRHRRHQRAHGDAALPRRVPPRGDQRGEPRYQRHHRLRSGWLTRCRHQRHQLRHGSSRHNRRDARRRSPGRCARHRHRAREQRRG